MLFEKKKKKKKEKMNSLIISQLTRHSHHTIGATFDSSSSCLSYYELFPLFPSYPVPLNSEQRNTQEGQKDSSIRLKEVKKIK